MRVIIGRVIIIRRVIIRIAIIGRVTIGRLMRWLVWRRVSGWRGRRRGIRGWGGYRLREGIRINRWNVATLRVDCDYNDNDCDDNIGLYWILLTKWVVDKSFSFTIYLYMYLCICVFVIVIVLLI